MVRAINAKDPNLIILGTISKFALQKPGVGHDHLDEDPIRTIGSH